jgi:hypothetical protein
VLISATSLCFVKSLEKKKEEEEEEEKKKGRKKKLAIK